MLDTNASSLQKGAVRHRASKRKGIAHSGHDARAELPGREQQRQDLTDRRSGAPPSEQTQAHRAQRARHMCGAPRAGTTTARPRRPKEWRPAERANAGASRTASTTHTRSSQGGSSNGKTRTVGTTHARSSQGGSNNGKTSPTEGAVRHRASKRRRIAHSGHDARVELPGWEQQRQDLANPTFHSRTSLV
jgi:hypothetical protein